MLLLALPLCLMLASYVARMLICRISARNEVKLAPAELAYLAREGDMTHTMVVLGFDLFHRALKRGDDSVYLLPYEKRLWQTTKDFLQTKAKDQVEKLTPLPKSSNPVEIVAKLSGSYKFLTGTARQVVRQILSDPRQLRKYFSPQALGRFVTDVLSSGYKDVISSEIIASLRKNGFLLAKDKQESLSSWLLIIAALGFAVLINLAWLLTGHRVAFVLLLIMATVNAVCFKMTFSILKVLPLYEEVNLVLKHVMLKNFAVRMCRILTRILKVLLVILVFLIVLLFFSIDLLVIMLFSYHAVITLLFNTALLTVSCYVLLSILLDSLWVQAAPMPTVAGAELVSRYRKTFADANIIESFKEILASPSYDPKVSELLAIYGYDTLWLMT